MKPKPRATATPMPKPTLQPLDTLTAVPIPVPIASPGQLSRGGWFFNFMGRESFAGCIGLRAVVVYPNKGHGNGEAGHANLIRDSSSREIPAPAGG